MVLFLLVLLTLIALKVMSSLRPWTGFAADYLENIIESWVDLDFKFKGNDFDWTQIPEITRALTDTRGRLAYKGSHIPNVKLNYVDNEQCYLLDFIKPYRPLVLNFVSGTDEPFRSRQKAFNEMARKLSWMVDFLTIVVGCGVEASRSDWYRMLNTDPPSCIHHHCCLQDRSMDLECLLEDGVVGDLVSDTYNNNALMAYSPMPCRVYVLYRSTIQYDSGRGIEDWELQLDNLHHFLWSFYRKRVRPDQKRYDVYYKPSVIQHPKKADDNQ